jgi:hypothetical protein
LCLTLGLFGKTRLLSLGFDALLRFDLGGGASFVSFASSALGVHSCGQRSSFAAFDRRLVKSEVRPSTHPEDQDCGCGQHTGVNAPALLRANRRQFTFVIEHPSVGFRLFLRFLFETDTQLRFIALPRHPLFFVASLPVLGLPRLPFSTQLGRFFFLSLLCFGCDALALGRFALNLLLFYATNTVFFDTHELAKIDENGRLFFLGHDDTYITLFRYLRTRAKASFGLQKR